MHHDASLNIRQLQVFEAVARPRATAGPSRSWVFRSPPSAMRCRSWRDSSASPSASAGAAAFSDRERPAVLQQAIRVLSELNELERQSALLKGEHSGTLCISTLDSIETETALSLPVVLRSFSDKFPHVHIKLIIRTPAEQLNGVLNNHIDTAIGSYNSQVHNIISEPLYREQHWLYCSDLHPMFFSRQLDKEQISQCPLVTRSYWNTSDLRRRGFSKGSATVETVDAQLLLILSGKYIGYLPEHYAWPWIKENRLRVLLPNEFGFQSPFSAICKRGRSNEPYLKAFRDLLKKTRWRGRSGIIKRGGRFLRRGGGSGAQRAARRGVFPVQNERLPVARPGCGCRQLPPVIHRVRRRWCGQVAGRQGVASGTKDGVCVK
nr:HTH-type transcriptional regulator cbl [Klebsiella pneumoniae]